MMVITVKYHLKISGMLEQPLRPLITNTMLRVVWTNHHRNNMQVLLMISHQSECMLLQAVKVILVLVINSKKNINSQLSDNRTWISKSKVAEVVTITIINSTLQTTSLELEVDQLITLVLARLSELNNNLNNRSMEVINSHMMINMMITQIHSNRIQGVDMVEANPVTSMTKATEVADNKNQVEIQYSDKELNQVAIVDLLLINLQSSYTLHQGERAAFNSSEKCWVI